MFVRLIHATQKPTEIAGLAAYVCRHPKEAMDLSKRMIALSDDERERLSKALSSAITSGHLSVVEHVTFSFFVGGISRACSHQLVRHRIASYTQASQRGCDDTMGYVVPESIKNDEKVCAAFRNAMDLSLAGFRALINMGIPAEDARFLLPHAAKTSLIVTMNARELHHFFTLRLCNKAQWEIRELAERMYEHALAHFPALFITCGPPCKNGPCMEKNPCGKDNA